MAANSAVLWPLEALGAIGAEAARLAARNIKATVVVSVVLICGAFAAASALQMRYDRVHALDEARYFANGRAADIAEVAAASLDRFEAEGRAFADGRFGPGTDAAVRNMAVFDAAGATIATLTGNREFVHLPRDVVALARSGRVLIGGDGLVTMLSPQGDDVVAVAFDAAALVPSGLVRNAWIASGGMNLLGGGGGGSAVQAKVAGWPAGVSVAFDDRGALAAWYGSLPLYFFVIFGPALVGAGLAALFVGEFEKRAKANETVRALRQTPQTDARLLVRLAQAERDAIEARRSKAEFIAHMSHELRTPLNAVIGFSEIIERGLFGGVGHPKYAEYARDIGMAGRGLHAKIGDILEFANLEAGRYPLRPAVFDLGELASKIVDEQMGGAFSRRIALDMVPCAPLPVRADPHAARKILVNLLSNALDYAPEGGRVRVTAAASAGACVVRVEDNGPGFRPDESAKAGAAFHRFDREGAKTGTGLGLAIAMSLAARMGAALRLHSRPGEGTRTELWIRQTELRAAAG